MNPEEELLLRQVREGDHGAFEQLVLRYQRKVYTIAYRFMGNPEDANDLAQETFLRVFRSIASFRGDSSLQTWIYHVAANICRDELRRRQKVQWVHSDDDSKARPVELIDPGRRPEEEFESKETQERLQGLINRLSEDYRNALIMRDVMGLSYEEVARASDCSLGTVKSRICRARQKLKDLVLENSPDLLQGYLERRRDS